MSIIDEELAEAFLDDPKSVDLSKATEITDTAAEILAGYEGDLDLSGQTSLSDAAAESLSKHKGNLCLYGLTDLMEAAARALAGSKGSIEIDGWDQAKVSHLLGQSLDCEVRNYQRIIPKVIENGVERVLRFDEGGDSEYKADFVFDCITVHVSCIENGDWTKLYVGVAGGELKMDSNVNDEFLRLFAKVAQSALMADEICLSGESRADISSGSDLGDGLTDEEWKRLFQTYPDFYWKYSSKTAKSG